MARWLAVASAVQGRVQATPNLVALLSSVLVFFVCVTKLVGLCAAHSNPQVLNRESEPEGELAAEAASQSRKPSQRVSLATIQAKLGSFRKSSFRNNGSFRKSSFRTNGSFRLDCTAQVDVVDALRPAAEDGLDESTGPAVWQRVILRGERCAPLEFSGLILYDEKGNPLPLPNGAPPRPNLNPSSRPYRSVTT